MIDLLAPEFSQYMPGCVCSLESSGVELVKLVDRIGREAPFIACATCGKVNGSKPIPRRLIPAPLLAAAPVSRSSYAPEDLEPCVMCGEKPAELHHFAPRKLFGWGEADDWPTCYLCQRCHAQWHRVVTPDLSGCPALVCEVCGKEASHRTGRDGRDHPRCPECRRSGEAA